MDPIRKQQKGTTMETIGKSFRVRIEQGLEFFSNLKQALKKVRLNPYRTDVLYDCNRLSDWIESKV